MTGQDQELTRKQKRRLAEFIEPFNGEPGSRVRPSTGFDPSLRGLRQEEQERSRAAGGGVRQRSESSGLGRRGVREEEEEEEGHIVGPERPVT